MLYYAASIFISAFLLFQIQPLISKYILPWFGGTPAVWSTALLFFQVLLTAGYAYAYWLVGKLDRRGQGLIHAGLLGFSLGSLALTASLWSTPITPGEGWRPAGGEYPILQVLWILTAAVGLPYLLLATNSTLMQAWFNRDHPGRNPYRLYALSNIASLLALISYPVLVEPNLSLLNQANLWSLAYLLFGLLALYGAFHTFRLGPTWRSDRENGPVARPVKVSPMARAMWVLLPACASTLLLAITNQITQDVAAIPFLWVLPLTIYLLSFILTFESRRWYSRGFYSVALALASGLYIWVILWDPGLHYLGELSIYTALLFVGCMVCHGELVGLRPPATQLTSFYLLLSLGGALGGVFVNLIAPLIFTGYFELQWGVFACWVLVTLLTVYSRGPARSPALTRIRKAVLVMGTLAVGYYMWASIWSYSAFSQFETRNYYGILRVTEINSKDETYRAYKLTHGTINHGFQFTHPDLRREPTSYFTQESGIGLAYLNHPRRPSPLKVGVLGLGVGAQTAYNQSGDKFRYYEINPAVVDLAQGQGGFFSYLADAPGQVTVVPGDGRLSLERELEKGQNQEFDLLVLDAFSGDSIPVHLITREAFDVYLQHLDSQGILAIDITNIHLDLRPIVLRIAEEYELEYAVISHYGDSLQSTSSLWALLSRDRNFINSSPIRERSQSVESVPEGFRLWTDDYSNLFSILK